MSGDWMGPPGSRGREVIRLPDPEWTATLAAIDAIESGRWDKYLLRVRAAIEQRRSTEEYGLHIICGR